MATSADHPGLRSASSAKDSEPWRLVPPSTLKRNTVTFQTIKGLRPDDLIQALEDQGFADILSLQFSTRGESHLTLGSTTLAESILYLGFHVGDRHVLPKQSHGVRRETQLHIHDVPIWIEDSNVASVLSAYGKVVGNIRHGRKQVSSGAFICTGVRFASFEPKPGVTIHQLFVQRMVLTHFA